MLRPAYDFVPHDRLLQDWGDGLGFRSVPNVFNHVGLFSSRGRSLESMKCGQQDFAFNLPY